MKCHILFSGKNKKKISKYRLLKILPRVLSVKGISPPGRKGTCISQHSPGSALGVSPRGQPSGSACAFSQSPKDMSCSLGSEHYIK